MIEICQVGTPYLSINCWMPEVVKVLNKENGEGLNGHIGATYLLW